MPMNLGPWVFPAGGDLMQVSAATTACPAPTPSGLIGCPATLTCGTQTLTIEILADPTNPTAGGPPLDIATAMYNSLMAQCQAFAQSCASLAEATAAGWK